MSEIGVDPECYVLTRSFLVEKITKENQSGLQVEKDTKSLAEAIQIAIEDWFFANERGIN